MSMVTSFPSLESKKAALRPDSSLPRFFDCWGQSIVNPQAEG
jgi:hypothetical protein